MTKHSMEIFNTTSHSDHTYRETVFQAPVPVRATLIVGANKALGAQRKSECGQCNANNSAGLVREFLPGPCTRFAWGH